MANKLQDIFSNQMFGLNGTLQFKDAESRSKFDEALKKVWDGGESVAIDGVSQITTTYTSGNMQYPGMKTVHLDHVMVGPAMESVVLPIPTACGEKDVPFSRYETKNHYILETGKASLVHFKIVVEKQTHLATITPKLQLSNVDNVLEAQEQAITALGLLKATLPPVDEQAEKNPKTPARNVLRSYENLISFFEKLHALETELSVAFNPSQIENLDEDIQTAAELSLLLIEKKILRLNGKLTSPESTELVIEPEKNAPLSKLKKGSEIALTFVRKVCYSLCGQQISLYTANLLVNAILEKKVEQENGNLKLLYGDTDSKPMYITFTAFKTEEEANQEVKNILPSGKSYRDALTVEAYLQK